MSSWRECKLGDIAEVIGGGTPKTSIAEYWNGNIPWLTPRDLTGYTKVYISHGERLITNDGLKSSSAKIMPKGTVLLTSRAPIGYVAIAENEVCTNQGFKSLVPNIEFLNSEFLYYWLKANIDYLQQLGTGTTFAEISGSVVKDIDIFLPPLEEQKAIAEVLSSLDDKIDLLHHQNKTLEDLAQTLFRQWFIEDVKEEWEEILITDLFEVRDGTHDSPKQKEFGKKLLTSKHILKNKLDFESSYFISEEDFEKINQRSIVEQGDILFSMIGTIGLTYLEQSTDIDYAIKNIGLFKTSQNKKFMYFVYLWLNSSFGVEFIHENRSGSTQEYISLGNLRNIIFNLPNYEILDLFNKKIEPIFEKIMQNTKQIQTLEDLRDTLLPKLLSGEVRVEI